MILDVRGKMDHTQFRLASRWLVVFSALCFVNAIVLGFVAALDGPQGYLEISMLAPFAHCGIWWVILIVHSLLHSVAGKQSNPDNEYLKKEHPEIWSKLHPWGDSSHNGFAGVGFLLGRYDNGSDEELNRIRDKQKRFGKILLWVFFLVPAVWILNLIAIGVAWIATK